jgi:hypothetical protein
MNKILIIILLLVVILLLTFTYENPLLSEIKRRYEFLIEKLKESKQFEILVKNRAVISEKNKTDADNTIAFNVNKGYEIHICLDGKKINGAMYVLLHELAHITVEEYDHTEQFWTNFRNLREYASLIGIYTPERELEYCGEVIHDSLFSDS